jgi:hypothetical protein
MVTSLLEDHNVIAKHEVITTMLSAHEVNRHPPTSITPLLRSHCDEISIPSS